MTERARHAAEMTTVRCVLGVVLFLALAGPPVAEAQEKSGIPRVGYLFQFAPAAGRHYWEACQQGLRDLGYVDGENIVLVPRWAEGRTERLPELAAQLVQQKVDVIVSAATPASRAVHAATKSIPIVFVAVADPVRAKLVASLARPGGNVTGVTLLTPELSQKRLQLLVDLVPQRPHVAVLQNPDNLSHPVFLEETRAAAATLGVQLETIQARAPEEIEPAFRALAVGRSTALIVLDDPVLWNHRKRIVGLAARHRLPAMYGYREFVDDGGLMSLGPARVALYRRTASYVDKILQGAKPADLPVEQPTVFEFVVNRKTAKDLGLVIPPSVLVQADEIID